MESFHLMNQAFVHDLNPQGAVEISLVDSLVFATWQLARARSSETNILFIAASRHTGTAADPDGNFDLVDHADALARAFEERAKTLDLISRYSGRYHRQILQTQ